MTRGLSANNVTASTALHVRPVVLVKLEFDDGTEYLHNAVGSITTLGQTWQGIGALGDIGAIEEGLDLSPFGVTMQLNALNSELLDIVTTEEVFNRRVTIFIGFLDDSGVLVADPQERWSGMMDNVSIRLGAQNAIALQCESDMRFFDRANGALFTNEDQQRRYAGDVFFEFLDQMINATVNWGGASVTFGTPVTPRVPSNPGPLPPGVYNNPYIRPPG